LDEGFKSKVRRVLKKISMAEGAQNDKPGTLGGRGDKLKGIDWKKSTGGVGVCGKRSEGESQEAAWSGGEQRDDGENPVDEGQKARRKKIFPIPS